MAEKLAYTGELRAVGEVDRESRTVHGYVVAQAGPFKTGRGEFDEQSLNALVELGNGQPKGVLSRVTHPEGDSIGHLLGRTVPGSFRVSPIVTHDGEGVQATLADFRFSEAASKNPNGDWPEYLMSLIEEDASMISTSIVLETEMEFRRDEHGRNLRGDDGNTLPPIWRPTALHATDIVDIGDAVDAILPAAYLSSKSGFADQLKAAEERLQARIDILGARVLHVEHEHKRLTK